MSNEKKQAFVQDLFQKNPALAIQDANFAVKTKFGEGMRLDDIILIKNDVKAGRIKEIPVLNSQMIGFLKGFYALFQKNVNTMVEIDDADIQLAQDVFAFLELHGDEL